ncbi:uncharacterized protein LOC127767254 [Oryza glaberrima]|uniref:uncharacterized protein LOC127767254 n=1 Tax=Oryza glaberrima TaxID=4538 RepID=UPI00224C3767|nr:uncharacterized protein LOC127767254 [Oryza glaberrima]
MAFKAATACAASAQGKLGRLVVTGVVPCNTGTLIDVATSPPFPDAKVELRCDGGAVARATTSQNGSFAMEADVASAAVAALAGACERVVDTPLARCDAPLPAAAVANLQQKKIPGVHYIVYLIIH